MDLAANEILEAVGRLFVENLGLVTNLFVIGAFIFLYLCYLVGSGFE